MELVNEYLEYVKNVKKYKTVKGKKVEIKNYEMMPSYEDFVIWLIDVKKKDYLKAIEYAGEYKGVLNFYSTRYLKKVISEGGRNSLSYIQLLKEINVEIANAPQEQVVINFDLTNSSDNKIGGSNVKEK